MNSKHHLKECPSKRGLSCTCQQEEKHYLKLALISLALAVAEITGGILSGSMALISDGTHVLMDGSENVLNIIVSRMVRHGYKEDVVRKLGAKISAFMLMIAGAFIMKEGIERIFNPVQVEGYMILVAVGGLMVNIYQQRFHHHSALDEHKNITHKWQDLHLISDIGASVAVVLGGAFMYFFGFYIIDGILSFVIGTLIVAYTIVKILSKNKKPCHHHGHKH